MADPLRVHRRVALTGEFHEVDAAARGIHLFVPEDIGGTDRQAETAVDTVFDDLFGRRVVRVKGAWQWISFGNGGHERALLGVTREHNRRAVLLANGDRGEKEGERKDREKREREKKERQRITQRRREHRAAQRRNRFIWAAAKRFGEVPRCLSGS